MVTAMREQRITRYASAFLLLMIAYSVYYPYRVIPGMLDFAFFEPSRMLSNHFTQGYVINEMRWLWFFMWSVPILAGLYGCAAALYSFYLCKVGRYFDPKFGIGLIHLGLAVSIGMISDILANSTSRKILTWVHPDGTLPFDLRYGSEDLALILCGFGFCALGLIVREAAKIAEENKAFV